MAGYSKRSLREKLGIKAGFAVYFAGAPKDYATLLGPLPEGVSVRKRPGKDIDFIHFFTDRKATLKRKIGALRSALKPAGMLWVSWPKGSSGVPTDLNENHVREIALQSGLVDIKVAAIDETWSGLKLVIPVKDRKG